MRDNNDLYFMTMPEFNEIFIPELQTDNIAWSLLKRPSSYEHEYFSVLDN